MSTRGWTVFGIVVVLIVAGIYTVYVRTQPPPPPPPKVTEVVFDEASCRLLEDAVAAVPGGFEAWRGTALASDDYAASWSAERALFGDCKVIELKRFGEVKYVCEADGVAMAKLTALVTGCLGAATLTQRHASENSTSWIAERPSGKAVIAIGSFLGRQSLTVSNPLP